MTAPAGIGDSIAIAADDGAQVDHHTKGNFEWWYFDRIQPDPGYLLRLILRLGSQRLGGGTWAEAASGRRDLILALGPLLRQRVCTDLPVGRPVEGPRRRHRAHSAGR
jgi:hypothetical protein